MKGMDDGINDTEIRPIDKQLPKIPCLRQQPTPKGYICSITGEKCEYDDRFWDCEINLKRYRARFNGKK